MSFHMSGRRNRVHCWPKANKLWDKEGVEVDYDTHADTQDGTVRMNVKMEAMFEFNAMLVMIIMNLKVN